MITNRWRVFLAAVLMLVTTGAYLTLSSSAAQARSGFKIGLTVKAEEYASTFAEYEDNGINIDSMRVFSSSTPPPWSDSRITSLNARGIVPFISWKTHNPQGVYDWLMAMPSNIPLVYLAEFHEAEADMSATEYKSRQIATWNKILTLPTHIRAKTRFGPIQTKQWTENTPGRSYATYDPGIGDFWGVDAYVNSWGAQDANSYPDHIQWLNKIQTYDTCKPYCRKKWLPELGAVSRCQDTNDYGRATWLNRVMNRLEDDTSVQLVLWWDTTGTTGAVESCLGSQRNFRLDEKTTYANGTHTTVTIGNPQETKRVYREAMQRNTP